jgi:acetolactate synthase-1/2/3 large subunit
MYSTATAILEALRDSGISYIFANLGSDHPAIIESLAEAKANGVPMPRLLTCPNEMVALSAAHGYAQATGQPQAVFVHVECGTQALAGAIHNASRGRVPVLIFAGMSPVTQEGELRGSRNEYIHWLQDVFDQRGIVRQYMRYDNEIRAGVNVKQLVYRALQFAASDPQGPVYLMCGREVLEQEVPAITPDRSFWPRLPAGPAPAEFIESLSAVLQTARRPLVVTSYLGRNPNAVTELVTLCERLGMGVSESFPTYSNFPISHPWHQDMRAPLYDADLVLVIDSDVPWIPTVSKPRQGVPVYHI